MDESPCPARRRSPSHAQAHRHLSPPHHGAQRRHELCAISSRSQPRRVVADSSYAALDLLAFCQSMSSPVTFITGLRMDAALYEPAPPRLPGQISRPRVKGQRLPTLKELADQPTTLRTGVTIPWCDGILRRVEIASHTAVWHHCGKAPVPIRWVLTRDPLGEFQPQTVLRTGLNVEPTRIIEWFMLRWQREVTFQEVRTHLGVETQRQWSDRAIARTTPVLLGLFSWITVAAHLLQKQRPSKPRAAAWYAKPAPTFVDAIALARRHMWSACETFSTSQDKPDITKVPTPLFNRFIESLTYAA